MRLSYLARCLYATRIGRAWLTSQKLEENFSSREDQPPTAERKRIVLDRIAHLQFVGAAVELADAKEAEHQGAVLPNTL